MEALKAAVISCPALKTTDYESDAPVVLAVDSSIIGFGYVLMQETSTPKKRVVIRFGSGN